MISTMLLQFLKEAYLQLLDVQELHWCELNVHGKLLCNTYFSIRNYNQAFFNTELQTMPSTPKTLTISTQFTEHLTS